MVRRLLVAALAFSSCGVTTFGALGCTNGTRTRDVAGDRRSRHGQDASAEDTQIPQAPPAPTSAAPVGRKPTVFVRASTRALALDAKNVFYGDSETDAIYAKPKAGGEAVRVARHTPVAGCIAVDDGAVAWVASPGDSVLRAPISGSAQPSTVRDRGIFSAVAIAAGHTFITEAVAGGNVLYRMTGATAARLASIEGPARGLLADDEFAYVVTSTKVHRTPHAKGEVEVIANGAGFAHPQIDGDSIYVVAEQESRRVVLRLPKRGGSASAIATDVRDAPFDVSGGELYYFAAGAPQLRAVHLATGRSNLVSEDEAFASPTAIAADDATVYVGSGARENGVIWALRRGP